MAEKPKVKLTGGQIAVYVTVVLLYVIAPMHSACNVVSSIIAETYNQGPAAVAYLISITNLLEVPAAFIFGIIAGRKLSYRMCVIVASALIVIGGLPALLGANMSWGALMATRVILGCGLGGLMPIVLGTVTLLFANENQRAYMMSLANIVFSVGMIVLTMVAGILGAISWQLTWVIYLWALVPLILAVFLMTPKNVPAVPQEDEKGEKVKIRLPVPGWLLLVLFLCGIIMSQSLFNYGGMTIAQVVPNPAIIGTIFSCFSIGAIAAAALFGPLYPILRAYVIPVFWVVGLVGGYFVWYVAHKTGNPVLFYVAMIFAGFGTNTMTVGVPMVLSTLVGPAIAGAVIGFAYVFQNGGGFISTPIDAAIASIAPNDPLLSPIWIFNIILGIVVLLGLLYVARQSNKIKDEMDAVEDAAIAAAENAA